MNEIKEKINVASYRCPFRVNSDRFSELNTGGLVGGLASLRKKYKMNWFCFDSKDGLDEIGNITVHRVGLDKETNRLYYGEFCNNYLWPMFHYIRKPEIFRNEPWLAYKFANELMVKSIEKELGKLDGILVNDYHLSLSPLQLSKRGFLDVRFFWHIPWINEEFLHMFPWTKELIIGISGARRIGFHLPSYANNFLNAAKNIAGDSDSIRDLGSRVMAVPLGIDYTYYENADIKNNKFDSELKEIRKRGVKIIGSLSRLDYTKGIVQKLEAFRNFLQREPQFQRKVVLVLVISPSREEVLEYRWYKENIDKLVGNMNSQMRTPEWTPVIYIYRKISQSEVLSLYRNSDIFLVTPIMDGLNLVAEEYISSNKNGFLILSKFAGISYYLDSTEKINPFDVEEFSRAIKMALTMNSKDREKRLIKMKETISKNDINNWLNRMVIS